MPSRLLGYIELGKPPWATMKSTATFSLLLALLGLFSMLRAKAQEDTAPLAVRPSKVREIRPPAGAGKPLEPSGLVLVGDQWLMVSDEKDVADIYQLTSVDAQTLQAEPFLKVAPIPDFAGDDLEAITYCRDRFYLVDEGSYTIAEVSGDGKAVAHPLDLSSVHKERNVPVPSATPGAGLEGIACDEAAGIVYVAQERQPRMIYAIDLSSFRTVDFFDVPAGWETPRSVEGRTVYADYSDLYFENGFLYALQRSDRMVLKIELRTKRLVARLRLDFNESDYYDYNEPFGMAEGLYLTQDRVCVVLDNNGVARIGNAQDTSPLFLEFSRPQGF